MNVINKYGISIVLVFLCLLSMDVAISSEENLGQAKKFMVVAANPKAVEAGYQILKEGGNALDAAVAIQMVLTLVEPQSSGIGGGAFLLYWDNQAKKLHAYDGRETAPQTAKPDRFLRKNGKPQTYERAMVGGALCGGSGCCCYVGKSPPQSWTCTMVRTLFSKHKIGTRGFSSLSPSS